MRNFLFTIGAPLGRSARVSWTRQVCKPLKDAKSVFSEDKVFLRTRRVFFFLRDSRRRAGRGLNDFLSCLREPPVVPLDTTRG